MLDNEYKNDREIVSNTGPFISLERFSYGFKLMRQLYDKVFIPTQVLEELQRGSPFIF